MIVITTATTTAATTTTINNCHRHRPPRRRRHHHHRHCHYHPHRTTCSTEYLNVFAATSVSWWKTMAALSSPCSSEWQYTTMLGPPVDALTACQKTIPMPSYSIYTFWIQKLNIEDLWEKNKQHIIYTTGHQALPRSKCPGKWKGPGESIDHLWNANLVIHKCSQRHVPIINGHN